MRHLVPVMVPMNFRCRNITREGFAGFFDIFSSLSLAWCAVSRSTAGSAHAAPRGRLAPCSPYFPALESTPPAWLAFADDSSALSVSTRCIPPRLLWLCLVRMPVCTTLQASQHLPSPCFVWPQAITRWTSWVITCDQKRTKEEAGNDPQRAGIQKKTAKRYAFHFPWPKKAAAGASVFNRQAPAPDPPARCRRRAPAP